MADETLMQGDLPIPFPVVGIGVSPTAVDRLGLLLPQVPQDGFAVVLVVADGQDGNVPLLSMVSRMTHLPVSDVEDGARVEPGRFYVTPPGHHVAPVRGAFRLPPNG